MKRFTIWYIIPCAIVVGGVWFYDFKQHVPPVKILEQVSDEALLGADESKIDVQARLSNPSFVNVKQADIYLSDESFGVSVELNGLRRYYPYQILSWHGEIEDTLGGLNYIVIKFDPTTSSATVEGAQSKTMSWAEWKKKYPYGEVLSNNTGWPFDYTKNPYEGL